MFAFYRIARRDDITAGPFSAPYVPGGVYPYADDHEGTSRHHGYSHGCPTLGDLAAIFPPDADRVNRAIWSNDHDEWAIWLVVTDRAPDPHDAGQGRTQCTAPHDTIRDTVILTDPITHPSEAH